MSVINNIFSLIEKNLKLKVIYLFFLTLIGTFLETLGVGIIFASSNIDSSRERSSFKKC